MRGGRFMSVEDIIFLMRKDKVRLLVQTEIEQMTPFSLVIRMQVQTFILHLRIEGFRA